MNIPSSSRSDKSIAQLLSNIIYFVTIAGIAAGVCLVPFSADALVKFGFEQKFFDESPQPILDHTVIEKDGVYHLFYLRGNPAVNIGRATSQDFTNWDLQEPILEPGTWDNYLWAPCVIDVPSFGWYLYFTGVNTVGAQQTGLAFSNDYIDWFKVPFPLYHPDPVWAHWDEEVWCHGRDPHVIEYNGKYYMFLTALTADALGAVACAESENLTTWTDIGPLYVHDSWHVLESVFIMERGGKFHMFFTEEEVYGTSHMTCDSLFGNWDISNRRIIDTGHAPQITKLPGGAEMFSRHSVYNNGHGKMFYTLRFDTLAWAGDIPTPYKPWALSKDWNILWGNAFIYQPVFENNPAARGEDVADTFEGRCWLGSYERYTGPAGYGTPGGFQGDTRSGVIRSKPFTITGNSMNLLVGGGNNIDLLYVALVDAADGGVLFKETGKNSDEMDRRYWDLVHHKGREVCIEIADMSTGTFGHINCDDICESNDILTPEDDQRASGGTKGTGLHTVDDFCGTRTPAGRGPTLHRNSPNPFNPVTSISYEIPERGRVTLRVYDVNGKVVRDLVDGFRGAGLHTESWNGQDTAGRRVASGIYLYRLTFEDVHVNTHKMLLLK